LLIPEVLLLLGGFAALYFGADWMVRGAAGLQGRLGFPDQILSNAWEMSAMRSWGSSNPTEIRHIEGVIPIFS